ncbi:MAG: PEP/pyruvate-binding domain-containing protein [Planctomycetota bacterium]|jgi:pyruvate,orthophosphate dikinase
MNGDLFWILPGSDTETADAAVVGAKAANLMRMARLALPVPPGFVLSTRLCHRVLDRGASGAGLARLLERGVKRLERETGRRFGDLRRPLLVSVRSGAAASMPGMMQTVLNVGLNERTVRGLIRTTGDPHLAWDSFRRLVETYAEVVHGCPPHPFRHALDRRVLAEGLDDERELDAMTLRDVTTEHLALYRSLTGEPFPPDPREQLAAVTEAVFGSWNSAPAVEYRTLNALDGLAGTAVTVQSMVFGNGGVTSGAGVGFTRDPATGEDRLYLDFLFGAQGEDVVSGRHGVVETLPLTRVLPEIPVRLEQAKQVLEREFGDIQDFEFTVQEGQLYFLQTRTAKRTPWAALHVAVDLAREGVIDRATALKRIEALDLDGLERQRLAPGSDAVPLARATPASIGVVSGAAVLDPERARQQAHECPVILVRHDTATEDLRGMVAAAGILTATGGRTSHAAVVARQLDKVCVVGCPGLSIDADGGSFVLAGRGFVEGEWISLDGDTGDVYAGKIDIESERPVAALAEIERWHAEPAGVACDPSEQEAPWSRPKR